eukprot:scaffold17369_cov97-Skeletonema_dohrnii-CCMP3373.AAC.2
MRFTFASVSVIILLALASPQARATNEFDCFAADGIALKEPADKYVAGNWTTEDNDQYGPIESWCTRQVTNMAYLFTNAGLAGAQFSEDLSLWDVSSVTTMERMFAGASAFNSDLSLWNVSSVTKMDYMFAGAKVFNSDLSLWNVSSVTTMERMFAWASAFNSDLSLWDVLSVNTMKYLHVL